MKDDESTIFGSPDIEFDANLKFDAGGKSSKGIFWCLVHQATMANDFWLGNCCLRKRMWYINAHEK
jgi:hypothetical protein